MNDQRAGSQPRRGFLKSTAAGAIGAIGAHGVARAASAAPQDEAPQPPGIDPAEIEAAAKVIGLEFTDAERAQMRGPVAENRKTLEALRAIDLDGDDGPAEVFDPRLPGTAIPPERHPTRVASQPVDDIPSGDADVAFAGVAQLGHWLRTGKLTSERLTVLYLERLKRIGQKLECVVTLTEDLALAQAKRADAELKAGKPRGPLHGIPWGAKDLFDTRGIATTFGAEPFVDRVPERDAAVVERLDAAGAVLVAKLTLGALAYGDIWHGGVTKNPFKTDQGSSGSSAGSASATVAGLVGFGLGTETYGSIGSPSARCGASGFRPTFGRVSRHGAMALCWSLDKVGPLCRSVEDCALVLDAIHGRDPRDEATIDAPLAIDLATPIEGARIGYFAAEYEKAGESDKESLAALEKLGCRLVPLEAPKVAAGSLIWITIAVEGAAAFDRLTRDGQDDRLKWQADEAWPNTFRAARLIPAVEFQQVRRLRRRLMKQTATLFHGIDAIIAPQRHGPMHAITNLAGQPAITIRQAFRDDGTPRAVTLWSDVFQDARLLQIASALERTLGYQARRPELG